jgi:hypothetical protein
MLFQRIFEELNSQGVKYLVIGGIAVNLHGFSRATGDLDIMISFDGNNISKFINVVNNLGLSPKIPVNINELADPHKRSDWVENRNMKVFSLQNPQNPMEQVDIMLESNIDFEELYNHRETMKAGDIDIPVCSIDDLIKLKEISGRERDNWDIDTLRKIKELKK